MVRCADSMYKSYVRVVENKLQWQLTTSVVIASKLEWTGSFEVLKTMAASYLDTLYASRGYCYQWVLLFHIGGPQ